MTGLRKIGLTTAGTVCILATLTGCKDEAAGTTAQRPVEVGVIKIEANDLALTTELPGRIVAYRVSDVRPQVSGILKNRLFQEGSEVKAGQQLYQIDPDRYKATLSSAEADLAKAQATLKSARAKAERYSELVRINAVSKQDNDDVVASLDQAKADVKSAKAALDLARIDLVYTKVNAPISGRIGKSNVTEGALVTANQETALSTVTQLDPIYVDLTQSSVDLIKLKRAIASDSRGEQSNHLRVTLNVEGDDQPYGQVGVLQFSDVTVDQSTGTVTVRAIFPNPTFDLLPGMFVRARIEQGTQKGVLTVPQKALVRDAAGGTSVWVPSLEGKAELRTIQVSRIVGNQWVVTAGLHTGDDVIIDGIQNLRPGTAITPVVVQQEPSNRPKIASR
ncbi:MAG: efflux RND transporter periplasmic adaptor subunit [Rhodospirillaceae bacterium]|nr:efflux RND transporter periplasmic adaptor subunit [Rhodospirillaceae bacterium]